MQALKSKEKDAIFHSRFYLSIAIHRVEGFAVLHCYTGKCSHTILDVRREPLGGLNLKLLSSH